MPQQVHQVIKDIKWLTKNKFHPFKETIFNLKSLFKIRLKHLY